MPSQDENRWRKVLLEAVDEGLLILGDSARKAIYFHLQSMCSLEREDIPDKPDVFALGLEKIFGGGARVIEESIVRSLYGKIGIECSEKKNADFVDCLNNLMEKNKQNALTNTVSLQ